MLNNLVATVGKNGVKAIDEVHKTAYLFIAYSNVTRCLVSHVYIVMLLHQSSNGSTHRNHIVVGVGREYNHTLGVGLCALGTGAIIYIGFAAGPTSNGVLQFVKHLDVYQTGLTVELLNQVSQSILNIILGRKLQQWLLYLLTQFDYLTSKLVVRHLNTVS